VSPWMRLALRGFDRPAFRVSFLDDPSATLFVLAPAEGSIAGAAVSLLDHLIRRWREKTARRQMRHRLLLQIDEATNVAPMPALRRYIGEGRGLGVNMMIAVQASSQLDTVYGHDYANEVRDIFPAALIMYGAPEMALLQHAEQWAGQTSKRSETYEQAVGGKTVSSSLVSMLDYRRLLPENRDYARLLQRGTPGIATEIPDFSVFVARYDAAVAKVRRGQPVARYLRGDFGWPDRVA
jgi:type IV secretory pathway TraG/TraD family ATPase VirD4